MASTDDAERTTLYSQAQLLIMDNALVLPIRDVVNLNGASVTVENLQYDPYGWFPLLANVTVKPTP
jgi:ABC-type transport system substrate-binding protein